MSIDRNEEYGILNYMYFNYFKKFLIVTTCILAIQERHFCYFYTSFINIFSVHISTQNILVIYILFFLLQMLLVYTSIGTFKYILYFNTAHH